MALNNYANLKTSIANWLGRTDLVNDIPDFVTLAENDFNAKFVSAEFNKMVNFIDFDSPVYLKQSSVKTNKTIQ